MRVLIAGCGDVGSVLATRLKCQGHRVFGLKRDTSTLPAGVEAVQADLTQVVTLTNLPTEIDRLIFMPTPACRNEAGYRDIFINGWTNLWESLEQKPVRTLLVSSTAVFAQSDGSLVNEESQTAPVRFNGRVLLDMERQAAGCTGQLVIVRLSGIYGPGRERLIELAATEGVETQQSPPFFTNRIHRDDAASALMHIMMINQPDKIYLVSDNRPAPRYEVLDWLARELGMIAPKGLLMDQASRGKRVDNLKLRQSGFRLKYPDYQAGYGSVLAIRKDEEATNRGN